MSTVVALCAATLGLFLAISLIMLRRMRTANLWLGMFVYSLASLAFADYCMGTGVYRVYPQLLGVFDWPVTVLGAFFYLYVRALLGLGVGRRQAIHLLPILATPLMHFAMMVFFIGAQCLAVGYAVAVLYRLRQYRRRVREVFSSTEQRDLHWMTWLTATTLLLLLSWLPLALLGGKWNLVMGGGRLAILFFVGWYGLRQAAVFWPNPTPAPAAPAADATPAKKYTRSGMTEAAATLIGERLQKRMAGERDFLNPDLTLTELADSIATSPQLLSQYLNDVRETSFFDYVNGQRVAEVQALMRDPANAGQTLLDLALRAGFSSKSTFNACFKKTTGMAPSAWRKQHAGASAPIGPDACAVL